MFRDKSVDVFKGLLIVFVVLGHSNVSVLHHVIFLFHMPLFFMISGYLIDENRILEEDYLRKKIKKFGIPYICYMIFDCIFIRRNMSLSMFKHMLWGGSAISGVYWYITCYLCSLALLRFGLKHFTYKKIFICVLISSCVAVMESNLVQRIEIISNPGMPLALDIALISILYIWLGFICKRKIMVLLCDNCVIGDALAVVLTIVIVVFLKFNYGSDGSIYYYFDMKPRYYRNIFCAVLVPVMFGIVFSRLLFWVTKIRFLGFVPRLLNIFGQMTLPIMFLHIPINALMKSMGYKYGCFIYTVVGLGIPVLISIIGKNNFLLCKMFGFPQLLKKE